MKKILIAYPEMMVGGSTTSLLAFLNCLDKSKYEVDLQLYKNRGPLLSDIPEGINLLPEAFMHQGKIGTVAKILKGVFSGMLLKAHLENKKRGLKGYSGRILSDFQAKHLSRRNEVHYDYAIGFLEGWSDRYIAYRVKANKKYAWLHSTFENITKYPEDELPWMNCVDNIVFVTEKCREDFAKTLPQMADKSLAIENITDSEIVRKRAEVRNLSDEAYNRFIAFDGFKVITVCRLDFKIKGLDRIVACAKKIKDSGARFLWYIVGDGPGEEELTSLIRENNVDDVLIPIGKRMNPYPFIKSSDIMCMPSRYEGKPMVITESMILGTPPVVTEYLSAHDQIDSGREGIVVNNDDFAVIDAVEYCIKNPDAALNMSNYLLSHEYGNKEYMAEIENKLFV